MSLRHRLEKLQAAIIAKREAESGPRTIVVLPEKDPTPTDLEEGVITPSMAAPSMSGSVVIKPRTWFAERLREWLDARRNRGRK